jgi:hypothetical protein
LARATLNKSANSFFLKKKDVDEVSNKLTELEFTRDSHQIYSGLDRVKHGVVGASDVKKVVQSRPLLELARARTGFSFFFENLTLTRCQIN